MKGKIFGLTPIEIVKLALPLLVVAVFTSVSFTNIMNDVINADSARFINLQSEKVEDGVVNIFQPPSFALTTLSENIGHHSRRNEISSLLKATASQYQQCAAFYFGTATPISDGGYQMTSDDWEAPRGFEHTSRPWFTGAVNAGGSLFAGEPYLNARSNSMCISFSIAVYDDSGNFIGVTGCDIMLDNLSDLIKSVEISPNTKTYIVDGTGLYLTNPDSFAIMKKSYFDDTKLDKRKHSASSFLDGNINGFVEKGDFFFARKLAATPWFLVMEGPTSDFTGTFKFWLRIIILIVALLIFANIVYTGRNTSKAKAKEAEAGEALVNETQNLVVASKENSATAQDQSAAVKEIVATMEDNNALSENISNKIKDVAGVATNTNDNVNDGVQYLNANVKQLSEIADANQQTIDGIKLLGEKITNIWDIVTLINSVADQAKIIAFNAELEASSAGEAGKNFHIVATEIRRLADGIIDGTKEIKEKINEIQQSSDSLILMSESGTEKIAAGVESAKNLEEKFTSIKNASEITANSATDITSIIQQQTSASEQILITLKQIAAGVENFTAATENISSASANLKRIAENLQK